MLLLLLTSKWCLERASAANFSHQPLTSHHLVILTFRMISFFYLYHRQCACVPEINNEKKKKDRGVPTPYAGCDRFPITSLENVGPQPETLKTRKIAT